MRSRIVRGPGGWDTLSVAWRTLLDRRPVTTHVQLEEWARAVWSAEDVSHSRWFCADDADGSVAVLHCTVGRRSTAGVKVRVLANGDADGLLADRCDASVLRRELLRAFARSGEPIDVVSLNRLRPGYAFHALAAAWPGNLDVETRYGGYSSVDTNRAAEDWFDAAGKNLRASLRKARNRLDRQGIVRTVIARTPDEVGAGFASYVALEAVGWKGAAGALVNRPIEREVLRAFVVGAAATGRARVCSLWVGDELAAALLCAVAGTSLVLLKTTYNEAFAQSAPGNVLMSDLVRECCDDREIQQIDLVTDYGWHDRWHPTKHPTFGARRFNGRRIMGLAGRAVSRLLDRPATASVGA